MWVYFWDLNLVPLMFVFLPILYCFDCYRFVVSLIFFIIFLTIINLYALLSSSLCLICHHVIVFKDGGIRY